MNKHGASNLAAGDARVGDLEAHADREREVGEVEVAGRLVTGKRDAADPLVVLAIVKMRVAEREARVRERPRDDYRSEAKRHDRRPLTGTPDGPRVTREQRRCKERYKRRERDEDVYGASPGILGARRHSRLRGVSPGDDRPRRDEHRDAPRIPPPERFDGEPEARGERGGGERCDEYGDAEPPQRASRIERSKSLRPRRFAAHAAGALRGARARATSES